MPSPGSLESASRTMMSYQSEIQISAIHALGIDNYFGGALLRKGLAEG